MVPAGQAEAYRGGFIRKNFSQPVACQKAPESMQEARPRAVRLKYARVVWSSIFAPTLTHTYSLTRSTKKDYVTVWFARDIGALAVCVCAPKCVENLT